VGVESPVRPARIAWRAPWPNPATGTVHLSLALPTAGDVAVEVLDLAGRKVRTLHRGVVPPGLLALRWDGTDERGASMPAGLYLVRAAGFGTQAVTRIVRVRS